ncbi:uncharacterized protein LOC110464569 [Mizuhopecten yessoensis]|nr:uncharacterized protein LOC110464569 [Mizuhopecten yessoensis]
MNSRTWICCVVMCVCIRRYLCQDFISLNYQEDKSLSEPFFLNLTIPDMFSCSLLCQQTTKCGSVSFDTSNKLCKMNTENSTDGTLTATTGYRFTDVTPSATLIGGCAARTCGDNDICILDDVGKMRGCTTALLSATTS